MPFSNTRLDPTLAGALTLPMFLAAPALSLGSGARNGFLSKAWVHGYVFLEEPPPLFLREPRLGGFPGPDEQAFKQRAYLVDGLHHRCPTPNTSLRPWDAGASVMHALV